MPDVWTLITPNGPVELNPTFTAPTYQPGGVDANALLRREGQAAFQRTGDGLPTPGPLRLRGRVWRDDRNAALMVAELNTIRDAVRASTSLRRTTTGGTYTYEDLAGGPPPAITPDGLGGWVVEIELWPARPEPTHLPPLETTPDGVWLETLALALPDGAPVHTWLDMSDANYHLRSIDPQQPTFRHNRTPTGAPAIETTAALTRLAGDTQWMHDGAEGFTFFLVAATTDDSFAVVVSNINTTEPSLPNGGFSLLWPQNAANDYAARFDDGNANRLAFAAHKNDGEFHILCVTQGESVILGGNGTRAFTDGEPDGALGVLSSVIPNTRPLSLFGHVVSTTARTFRGEVAAFLWFRRELTDTERGRVHNYLRHRYIGE